VATSTVHQDGPEICIHELGHSFGGLSDEYWVGPSYARENINMTQESDTSKVKWKRWLGFSSTGIYPHSESPSWYRPHQNCEMRYLHSNFCPVCKEQIVTRILNLTSPIISYLPEGATPDILIDSIFKVNLLAPEPNTLKTWWELNRNEIAVQTDSFSLSTRQLSLGSNTLSCYILDTTALIRNPAHPSVHLNKVTWNINYQPSGIDFQAFSTKASVSIFPNPAGEILTLSYKTDKPSSGRLQVRLIDSSGKQVMRQMSFPLNGSGNEFSIPLPQGKLASGLYYLLAQSPDFLYRLPVVIN